MFSSKDKQIPRGICDHGEDRRRKKDHHMPFTQRCTTLIALKQLLGVFESIISTVAAKDAVRGGGSSKNYIYAQRDAHFEGNCGAIEANVRSFRLYSVYRGTF